jgi:hypothetical protein
VGGIRVAGGSSNAPTVILGPHERVEQVSIGAELAFDCAPTGCGCLRSRAVLPVTSSHASHAVYVPRTDVENSYVSRRDTAPSADVAFTRHRLVKAFVAERHGPNPFGVE